MNTVLELFVCGATAFVVFTLAALLITLIDATPDDDVPFGMA